MAVAVEKSGPWHENRHLMHSCCALLTCLQAALPFKTKPKLEPKRKHKSLEQRRAVVLEPHEKKAYALVQQLNAIRNEKGKKRAESNVSPCMADGAPGRGRVLHLSSKMVSAMIW